MTLKVIWIPDPEIFACGIRNPGLWNLESGYRSPESRQRVE